MRLVKQRCDLLSWAYTVTAKRLGHCALLCSRTDEASLRIAACDRPTEKTRNAMFDRICEQRRVARVYCCGIKPSMQNTSSDPPRKRIKNLSVDRPPL